MKRPRILLADDHRLVAEGLRSLLQPEFELVGVVEDGRALVQTARQLLPDVIVADIGMPKLNGLEALIQLKKDHPGVKVVMMTMHRETAYARRAIEAGASGFVLKHSAAEELITAIRAALEGKTYITPAIAGEVFNELRQGNRKKIDPDQLLTSRQREILQLVAEGRSAKEIAAQLDISTRTVEFHKYQMMEALAIHSSAELVHYALKNGIAPL
ncbi:MAG TPA: response regulator transcription factor [Candidatus Acidoferrum sp.]|nr:response regulator transcription factor [Candidatus Acidoferrum sp.]